MPLDRRRVCEGLRMGELCSSRNVVERPRGTQARRRLRGHVRTAPYGGRRGGAQALLNSPTP